MNCQNCDAAVLPSSERCEKCGAKLLHRRSVFEAPRREDFHLTREESYELDQPVSEEPWQFSPPSETPPTSFHEGTRAEPVARVYGGFFRRAAALSLDLIAVALLAAMMGLMAYVGYKVGLAAYDRPMTRSTMTPLATLLAMSTMMLATAYFVLFHGIDGQTIGKRLLRLRVVGPENERMGYLRAALRWIATLALAPLLLGFLWVFLSREKRAWHDYLARTWVVRE
jgi:uncharacterized RDD family membrane protein YckC